jgi:hypothetical protein
MSADMEFKKPITGAGKPGAEEHYAIRILKNGVWLYQGTPISRINMVKYFASSLKKDERGGYWLVTPYERGRIIVEDAPFVAVELENRLSGKDQVLRFRTNLDDWVTAGPDYPLRVQYDSVSSEPVPYIMVRNGMEARIARAVYYELAALAVSSEHDAKLLGLWSAGAFFPLGRI